jgi:hypothetical protein
MLCEKYTSKYLRLDVQNYILSWEDVEIFIKPTLEWPHLTFQQTIICTVNHNCKYVYHIPQNEKFSSPFHCVNAISSHLKSFLFLCVKKTANRKQTPWLDSASELYRLSDRRLLAKLVSTFADRWCHVVSVTDSYSRILGCLNQGCYFFFQVASKLYSRGWVDPVSDPLLLRKIWWLRESNPDLWICSQELWTLDHRGSPSSVSHWLK